MNIPLAKPNIDEEEKEAVIKVLESGWITMGKVTEQLEEEFANYKGCKYAIAVNSCSSALWLAVKAILEDDEPNFKRIITTPMSFCATTNAILNNDHIPLFLDIEKNSRNIDLGQVGSILSHSYLTKEYIQGIIPVHFGGDICDIDSLKHLSKTFGLKIIIDSAHKVEGEEDYIGDASCYSFNPTKNLFAPEMGMVCTNDEDIANKIKSLRMHGLSASAFDRINKPGHYDVTSLGYKFNCTDMESAIALCQLKKLDDNLTKRENISDYYFEVLEKNDFDWDDIFSGSHLFQILIPKRDEFVVKIREKGICCGIHYKPIHLFSYLKGYEFKKGMFPRAERFGEMVATIPLGPGMTDNEVEYVTENMIKTLKELEII